MSTALRVAVVGDYTAAAETHPATTEALHRAARSLGLEVEVEWIATPEVNEEKLQASDAIWAAANSPYQSFQGMLQAIRFARKRQWPFVGT